MSYKKSSYLLRRVTSTWERFLIWYLTLIMEDQIPLLPLPPLYFAHRDFLIIWWEVRPGQLLVRSHEDYCPYIPPYQFWSQELQAVWISHQVLWPVWKLFNESGPSYPTGISIFCFSMKIFQSINLSLAISLLRTIMTISKMIWNLTTTTTMTPRMMIKVLKMI